MGADGRLDRKELARLAFEDGRVEELNAIVHPATIARQEELVRESGAEVVTVEEDEIASAILVLLEREKTLAEGAGAAALAALLEDVAVAA